MQALEKPHCLRKRINNNPNLDFTKSVLAEFGINTVCRSAQCPNIFDCFSKRRVTFLILGNSCTRNCTFCSVEKKQPEALDKEEPNRIAEVASVLGLRHIVITSVTRDDLGDGGSGQFVKTIEMIRKRLGKKVGIEVLVPDFKGDKANIKRIVDARPDIFGHNVETAPRLYKKVRPKADYQCSIDVLRFARKIDPDLIIKSGFMLGLGETEKEIVSVMRDLRMAGCNMLAIGQYLRPSREQVEVKEFVRPVEFLKFEKIGYSLGFQSVQSGPFVRSSYENSLQ